MKIGLPYTLSKHCSSTSLIVGTRSKEMREYTELFTYNFVRDIGPLPPETRVGLQHTFIPTYPAPHTSEFNQKIHCLSRQYSPEVFAVLKNGIAWCR